MPKMKTHSGAAKRLKKLKSGLIKLTQSGRRHNFNQKTRKRKRHLRHSAYVCPADMGRMARLLPN